MITILFGYIILTVNVEYWLQLKQYYSLILSDAFKSIDFSFISKERIMKRLLEFVHYVITVILHCVPQFTTVIYYVIYWSHPNK